jgi:hypothetical protein
VDSQSTREFKPFVSARIAEIHSKSEPCQWRHISGELNVAYEVSRGIPAQELTERWKHGTEFLQLSEEQWLKESLPTTNQTKEDQAERRKPRTVLQVTNRDQVEVIVCKKFSSWKRLLLTILLTIIRNTINNGNITLLCIP